MLFLNMVCLTVGLAFFGFISGVAGMTSSEKDDTGRSRKLLVSSMIRGTLNG
jgi:hypothetical protein